nr:PAS domain S-box protein [Sodalinema gerasimenkoae]
MRDITLQKQASQPILSASAENLKSLFERSPFGIILNAMDGQFVEANPAVLTLTGYSLEELKALTYWDLTPEDYADDEAQQLDSLQTRGHYGPYRKEYIHKQGHRIPIEITGVLITGTDGQPYIWSMITNISQRLEAERALEESHIRWQLALEAANIGTWDWNPQTGEITFDPLMKAMLGYEAYELKNHIEEWESRLHPDDLPYINQKLDEHFQGITSTYQSEHRTRCKDGSYKWTLDRGQIVDYNEQGQPIRFLGIYQDIDERKTNELALRRVTQQLQKAQEVAHLGYWSFDVATETLTWSDEVFYIFGMTPDMGEPSFEEHLKVYDPEQRSLVLEHVTKAKEGISQNFDSHFNLPNHETRYINIRIETEWQNQKAIRVFGIIIDITDRHTEEALRASEEKLRSLFELSPLGITFNQIDGKFIEANATFCKMVGYSLSELNALHLRDLTPPNHEDFEAQKLRELQKKGRYGPYQKEYIHKDGHRVPVEITGAQVGNAQDYVWSIIIDITERKQAEAQLQQLLKNSEAKSRELQQAYRELQEAQLQLVQAEKMSSLGQLVAGIAHEINNPISFIYGNLEPASNYAQDLLALIKLYQTHSQEEIPDIQRLSDTIDLDFLVEDFPKIIQSMKMGASRIRDIVTSLRTFSRLDEADCKAVDLHLNLESTLVLLQNRLNGRGGTPEIRVIKQYGNLPPITCYISLLNQVFINLLSNAIDAIEIKQRQRVSPEYQGVITITTTMTSTTEVLITIADNGKGMTAHEQSRLFNPFFTTKPIGQGTGMGLPTSYQIVTQNHGGELGFSSQSGVGSEFHVRLPTTIPNESAVHRHT